MLHQIETATSEVFEYAPLHTDSDRFPESDDAMLSKIGG
jgi:hypothetical protein